MAHSKYTLTLTGLLTLLLAACGGGGGDGGVGTMSIALTDAPVDDVDEVWVEFSGYTLKPADDGNAECILDDDSETSCDVGAGQIEYTFDEPRAINLKELTDGRIELLFEQDVPAGRYNWIKLNTNAQFDEVFDSYVVEDTGGQIELRVPPDRLKLGNGFTITANGDSAFVIEWNLRMGLTNPVGQPGYKLQPSLRITDLTEWGTIAGTVDSNLLPPVNEACTSDENTGDGNVVYIYAGADVIPDDIDGIDADPLTTADVRFNDDSGNYEYMAPFLSPGEYTVAFTCQGADDVVPDPEQPELDVDDELEFTDGINATVSDDAITTIDFIAI